MSFEALSKAILAGALFSSIVSGVYWWFRRHDPPARSQTVMVFIVLFLIIAVRQYVLHAP